MEPIKVKRKMRESTRCKRRRRRVEGGKLVAWRRLRLFRQRQQQQEEEEETQLQPGRHNRAEHLLTATTAGCQGGGWTLDSGSSPLASLGHPHQQLKLPGGLLQPILQRQSHRLTNCSSRLISQTSPPSSRHFSLSMLQIRPPTQVNQFYCISTQLSSC